MCLTSTRVPLPGGAQHPISSIRTPTRSSIVDRSYSYLVLVDHTTDVGCQLYLPLLNRDGYSPCSLGCCRPLPLGRQPGLRVVSPFPLLPLLQLSARWMPRVRDRRGADRIGESMYSGRPGDIRGMVVSLGSAGLGIIGISSVIPLSLPACCKEAA